MMDTKRIYWLMQITGWTAYGLLIFLSVWTSGQKVSHEVWTQLIINIIVCVFISHTMRYLIIRYNWFNYKLSIIVFRIILLCIVFGFIIQLLYTFSSQLFLGIYHNHPFSRLLINGFAYSLVLLCWNGIYFTYLFFQKSKNQEVQTIHLKASKNEMQLKSLRNQLNPHFLFNALNSIRALIDLEPQTAKDAVTQLAGLLRKSLLLGEQNVISIEQELEIVTYYLQLEKMRFEERLNYTIQIENPEVLLKSIPPFLIQNLVENSIKHGISKSIEGGNVDIICSCINDEVLISIINIGELTENDEQGIGINNTRQRLRLLYNNTAGFTLQQEGDQVVAKIHYKS